MTRACGGPVCHAEARFAATQATWHGQTYCCEGDGASTLSNPDYFCHTVQDCGLAPINCDGYWSDFSPCDCTGTQWRTYVITTYPEHYGTPCPSPQSRHCITSAECLLPPPSIMSSQCDMDRFEARLAVANEACCLGLLRTHVECPDVCSFECAVALVPLMSDCRPIISAVYDGLDGRNDGLASRFDTIFNACLAATTTENVIHHLQALVRNGTCSVDDLDGSAQTQVSVSCEDSFPNCDEVLGLGLPCISLQVGWCDATCGYCVQSLPAATIDAPSPPPHGCCTSQVCECEGLESCTVVTDAVFEWLDIMATDNQITMWRTNGDYAWFQTDLPFSFEWFGKIEPRITIGINGVLTFGNDVLRDGGSQPVPCKWNGGGHNSAAQDGCVQYGNAGDHYGSVPEINGIIAVFWMMDGGGNGEGVYYSALSNKFIVE